MVKCRECGNERVLKVSYYLGDFKHLYHWCPICKKNTYHEILARIAP